MQLIDIVKNQISSRGSFIAKMVESFFGKISQLSLSMFFSFVCTRLYGVEIFGKYTYAFTLISFLMIFAKAGLDNGLMYHIPRDGNRHISFSFLINFILSVLIITVAYFIVEDATLSSLLPMVWLVFMEQIFFGIYRSSGKIKEFYFIFGFLSFILRIIFVITLYFVLGQNVKSIVIAVYLSFIISISMYFIANRRKFGKVVFDFKFVKYSFPLIIASIMGVIMGRIDIIMLGNMTDNRSVGIYQISAQVANYTSFLLAIFNTVFAPRISALYHQGRIKELKKTYQDSTRILGLVALISLIIIIVFSKKILYLFGPGVVEGQYSLIYRAIGQFVNTAVGSVWLMLSMTGNPKFQMYGNLTVCIINVVLNSLLIPVYGISGAAFASMVAMVFINILGYIFVSIRFKVKAYGII